MQANKVKKISQLPIVNIILDALLTNLLNLYIIDEKWMKLNLHTKNYSYIILYIKNKTNL